MLNRDINYIQIFDSLPDLLKLTMERCLDKQRLYAFQDELREQCRTEGLAFKWSMPLRCYGVCRKFTQVIHELENPTLNIAVSTSSSHIHAIREHGVEMDTKLKKFLAATA